MNNPKKLTVRSRFAPSPTGYLHIGGARTALFAWLFARHHGGQFILRIEDTDRERSTEESIDAILAGLAWLGIDYDEGPYYQTKRLDRYQEIAEKLINEGKAYRCHCSKERLEQLRQQQLERKEKPRYDGHCRNLELKASDQPYVVRFRSPDRGQVVFHDLIRGKIRFDNCELDDLVIVRSDGIPTYNFAVVIDDWDMKITHVIRGDDHVNNTPRQIHIFEALGAEIPIFAHVPMILGHDGKRLSKRHGAVSVLQYQEDGILPEALMNYLIRLGWAHGDQEIFNREEMIRLFAIEDVNRAPAIFNPEKLLWLNQQYMKMLDASRLIFPFTKHLKLLNISFATGPQLEDVIAVQAERAKTILEMAQHSTYFFKDVENYDEKSMQKHFQPEILPALEEIGQRLNTLSSWNKEEIHQVIIDVAEKYQFKLGKIAQPLRVAMTGDTMSPPIDLTLFLIGKEAVNRRIKKAIQYIKNISAK